MTSPRNEHPDDTSLTTRTATTAVILLHQQRASDLPSEVERNIITNVPRGRKYKQMLSITIRDKQVADDQHSPYIVLVTRDSMSYTAYTTIAKFMEQWHDTLSAARLNSRSFVGQGALYLTADYKINDISVYNAELEAVVANGARFCEMLSNGSVMPGAILVDEANKQTTFFRLNPNDARYKELEKTRNVR